MDRAIEREQSIDYLLEIGVEEMPAEVFVIRLGKIKEKRLYLRNRGFLLGNKTRNTTPPVLLFVEGLALNQASWRGELKARLSELPF